MAGVLASHLAPFCSKSIAELQGASQMLRDLLGRHLLPEDQRFMKYQDTEYIDVHLYRSDRASLLDAADGDHGLQQLRAVLNQKHSALVIAGGNGISSDAEDLSKYLLTFQENTMMNFLLGGELRWTFKSRDLGHHLNSSAPEADVDPRDNLRSYLALAKLDEDMAAKGWAMLRLFGSVDTYDHNYEPRPPTPRMIRTLESVAEKDMTLCTDGFALFQTQLELARAELDQ
ncbi:uncharacterized protein PAC_17127 [Phialocephala subalpina]|uniref:Uncharacterized protein n=1 Tax=Phialocephala subalpina TaxID=576137 RepID=A0A1L7XQI7_9HELO|nr:uncharacterized protein PAC_17127 [Phialocephala subalpina]